MPRRTWYIHTFQSYARISLAQKTKLFTMKAHTKGVMRCACINIVHVRRISIWCVFRYIDQKTFSLSLCNIIDSQAAKLPSTQNSELTIYSNKKEQKKRRNIAWLWCVLNINQLKNWESKCCNGAVTNNKQQLRQHYCVFCFVENMF